MSTTAAPGTRPDDPRDQALANLRRKRKLANDLMTYVAVNGVLWIIWLATDRGTDGSIPWPAWVSIIWGFLLAVDAWKAYGSWPASLHRPIGDDEIEREIARHRT
jgi:2TM domain